LPANRRTSIPAAQLAIGGRLENQTFYRASFPADLRAATFVRCRFKQNNLAGSALRETVFERCRFAQNVFNGADLRGTRFVRCRGLRPAEIALLEQSGALVEKPQRLPWGPLLLGAVLAAGLFLLAGGWARLKGLLLF